MIEHPGTELQVLIREKGLTQKAFSSILGKKVSEVNELLKGKRNITIQRDYLLHQTLGTPMKYWILKQVDYDYSLLDIEETNKVGIVSSPNGRGLGGGSEGQGEVSSHKAHPTELGENPETSPLDKGDTAKPRGFEQPQETPIQDSKLESDEDLKNRADIFRSF